jgi:peptidoglycan/xylan/chitin deacetylase (PgdA/CDA1 family)
LGNGFRSARARVAGAAIVLMYHRVADLTVDPQRLAVGVDRFDEQMRVLSTSFNPLAPGELLELMAHRKRIPERSVVVTMDDGYSDALANAEAILASHAVPAGVFVSSDYVGGHAEFWWDELERIVLCSEELPSRLNIAAGSARYSRQIAPQPGSVDEYDPSDRWDITKPAVTERQRIYLELREFVLPLSSADRDAALESLRGQFGVEALVRPSHRPLTATELRQLGDGGIVEICAHTRSHQLLAARTPREQADEILGGKIALEQACGCQVRLFSYPYGDAASFSESSVLAVRDAGFLGAFTTRFGITLPWTDRFGIPRCPTADISGAQLAERLDSWFEMAR